MLCPEGTMLADAEGVDATLHDSVYDCSECATATFSMPARDECIGCEQGEALNRGSRYGPTVICYCERVINFRVNHR